MPIDGIDHQPRFTSRPSILYWDAPRKCGRLWRPGRLPIFKRGEEAGQANHNFAVDALAALERTRDTIAMQAQGMKNGLPTS